MNRNWMFLTRLAVCGFAVVVYTFPVQHAVLGAAEFPWADACVVWHLGDAEPSEAVLVQGNAQRGVALEGAEREESLAVEATAKSPPSTEAIWSWERKLLPSRWTVTRK